MAMKWEDVLMVAITVLIYITFIFQFLAAACIGLLADHIHSTIAAVCMTGICLGLLWFLAGCISLTIITYTSDYWHNWRETNKQFSIVMDSINKPEKKPREPEVATGLPADASA